MSGFAKIVSKDVCSDPSGFSRIKQETMERILWEGGKGDEGGRLKGGESSQVGQQEEGENFSEAAIQ